MLKMSQNFSYVLMIIVFQLIYLSEERIHYSEPDLTNPNIPEELRKSCGYRYGVIHSIIRYSNHCFQHSYNDRYITTPITISKPRIRQPMGRVLAGQRVNYREAPWVVQLVIRNYKWYGALDEKNFTHHCTGVLITMRLILTAAHCKHDYLSVYLGKDNTTQGWRSHKFDFHQHPNFDTGTFDWEGKPIYNYDYDIAIIDLKEYIDWQNEGKDENGMYLINTICLPLPENVSDPNIIANDYQMATIFGWGKVKMHKYPEYLQRGDFWVEKRRRPKVGRVVELTSFADNYETRPCLGDSGSGIVQYIDGFESRAVLIAIQSMMTEKTPKKDRRCTFLHIGPLWAVRVVEYLDWINEYLKKTK